MHRSLFSSHTCNRPTRNTKFYLLLVTVIGLSSIGFLQVLISDDLKNNTLYWLSYTSSCLSYTNKAERATSANSRVTHSITESQYFHETDLNTQETMPIEKNNKYTFHAANELLLKTVMIIRTFNRPFCLLKLLNSLQKYSPYINVLIVDDSFENLKINSTFLKTHFPDYSGQIYVLNNFTEPMGISKGRNIMIDSAKKLGFQYVIMSDDDYEVQDDLLFVNMVQIYIKEEADIVATARDDVWWEVDKSTGIQSRHVVKGDLRNSGTLVFDDKKTHMTIVPNITNVMLQHEIFSDIRAFLKKNNKESLNL